MDGDGERVVECWWRGEPGEPGYEQVQIVKRGAGFRVRWVGRARVPDVKAPNYSAAIQVATRWMLRDWRRVTPPAEPPVPSQRGGGSAVRLARG